MFGGYESPITQIMGQIQTQMEDDCMKVVQQCGFDVNKEELARALVYDRDQYNKGYDDGYTKAIDDFKRIICEELKLYIDHEDYMCVGLSLHKFTRELAEQLKAGGV